MVHETQHPLDLSSGPLPCTPPRPWPFAFLSRLGRAAPQVLHGESHVCEFTLHEQERQDAKLRELKAVFTAEQAADKERGFLCSLATYEASKGCGLRVYKPLRGCFDGVSDFRRSDIVYCAPSTPSVRPGIAVVFAALSGYGGSSGRSHGFSVRTGELRLLMWDEVTSKFTGCPRISQADAVRWQLMPPCCGRGAHCPHLLASADPQWPNGDELDLSLLTGIPGAFAKMLENELRQPGRQQQQSLRAHFKPLLQLCGMTDDLDENESLSVNAPKRQKAVHGSHSMGPVANESDGDCGNGSDVESGSDGESESGSDVPLLDVGPDL